MPELDDHELLAEFARNESEAAFAALVTRYVNLVYSTGLRFTGNPHHAEEITQAVFIILARKAGKLSPRTVLSGWLYQTAQLTAANFVKGEIRRQHREQEAYMQSTLTEPDAAAWQQLAPQLDEAMGRLGETDRNAIVLRFFENKSAQEVGAALKLTEAAAHKHVNRALEKLRKFFMKRGVDSTTATIAETISIHSVQAAPVTLAKAVTAVAVAKGAAASASTLTLIKGALKLMVWTKAKTAIVIGAAAILATTTGTVAFRALETRSAPKLQMRVFKVNSRVFLANLLQAAQPAAGMAVTNIFPAYLASKGISILPPKAIAFNDGPGLLSVKATASDLKAIEKIVVQLNYAPPQIHMKARFIEVPESDAEAVLNAGTVLNTTNNNSVEILDDDKVMQLFRRLSSDHAVTLGEPEAVTLSGHQTQMRVEGATMDFVPALYDNGYTIKLWAEGVKVNAAVHSAEILTATVNLWDNQTLALGSQKTDGQSRLFVLVTTTLVDPAGNRFHSQANLQSKLGTIPPQ